MSYLLAQTPAPVFPTGWETLLFAYGPLGVIAAVLLYFVMWYGPRFFEANFRLMNTCEVTQKQIADSLKSLSETATTSDMNHSKTHEGLRHLACAADAHAKKRQDLGSDVVIHLENAKKALEK